MLAKNLNKVVDLICDNLKKEESEEIKK